MTSALSSRLSSRLSHRLCPCLRLHPIGVRSAEAVPASCERAELPILMAVIHQVSGDKMLANFLASTPSKAPEAVPVPVLLL